MHQHSPAMLFRSALSCYQQRQFGQAETLCSRLLQLMPNSAEALHLMALCLMHTAPQRALQYFQQAVTSAPANAEYKKNYANYLLRQQSFAEALPLFQQLYQQTPKNDDVAYGLAFVLHQKKQHRGALNIINNTEISPPVLAKWRTLEARALLECGETAAAARCLEHALQQAPQHPGLAMTRVLQLRQQQQPQQALDFLQHMPVNAVTHYLSGCLYYDLQQFEQAEYYLQQALSLQPEYIDAHTALNKLYWEHNNQQQFLNSFRQALIAVPKSVALYLSYISHLLLAEKLDEAISITKQAIANCGEQHQLLHALGTLLYKRNDSGQALPLYQQALAQAPHNVRYLLDNANLELRQQNYATALTLLHHARDLEPDNQEVWAYLGLCWRLTGDAKHDWLNNYPQLISVKKLPTPPGYSRFSDFWQELKAAVNSLHTTEQQPLDQSVRNGTQTVGFLFNSPAKVIQIYRDLLNEQLRQYLAGLPQDTTHPLLRRITPEFRFSGCWSVKLQNNGFHTNHVHPQGWLSVCTYLQVPDSISLQDPLQQGWLKLGETSLQLGDQEQIARAICPQEGLCVIFPSYVWHGTVPFQGNEARITLPCDVVPDI